MRRGRVTAWRGAVGALAFALATGAHAETWEVLLGSLGEAGAERELTGWFEAEPASFDPGEDRRVYFVSDFTFAAGDDAFTPAPESEFDGLPALLIVVLLDQIGLVGDDVALVRFRAGGEVVAFDDETVTFRFLDFRTWSFSDPGVLVDAGDAVGTLGDVPRRLHLSGTLYEVEETFELRREPCGGGLAPPVSGPGLSVVDARDLGHSLASFDLAAHEPASFTATSGSGGIVLASGPPDTISGEIVAPPTPPVFTFCPGLWPLTPAIETEIGPFELVATAARPLDLDVEPRRPNARIHPDQRRATPVAIRGDDEVDVREIDVRTLRLGPGEAEPGPGRFGVRRVDYDRDGDLDLFARFPTRDTGVSAGDTFLCLLAETRDGALLEGCDEIRTPPPRPERSPRPWPYPF